MSTYMSPHTCLHVCVLTHVYICESSHMSTYMSPHACLHIRVLRARGGAAGARRRSMRGALKAPSNSVCARSVENLAVGDGWQVITRARMFALPNVCDCAEI